MDKSNLEKLFGPSLSDAVILEMAKSWDEADVSDYLKTTGYEADPSEVVSSLRREAASIAAGFMGQAKSERKAASSRLNGRKGGRPRLTLRERAEDRVEKSKRLSKHKGIIFYDWDNETEHLEWVCTAPVIEILGWAEAAEKEE